MDLGRSWRRGRGRLRCLRKRHDYVTYFEPNERGRLGEYCRRCGRRRPIGVSRLARD
jgi:hypothetical protein